MFRSNMFHSNRLALYMKYLKNGNTLYLKYIFCVFAESSKKHKLTAAKVIAEYLDTLSVDELWRAEKQMRDASSIEWSIDWRKYKLKNIILPQMAANEAWAVTAFASFCSNGYMREDAVKALVQYENSLPIIALRLGDWVSEVRESSEAAFLARTALAAPEELISAFVILEKSKGSLRASFEKINTAIAERLAHDSALISFALSRRDVRTRKFCIFLLCRNAYENKELLLAHIKREKDPFLRKAIFSALLHSGTEIESLFPLMLADKYPANRVFAIANMPHSDEIYKMLFDTNASVRAFARAAIEENAQGQDFLAIYKSAITERTKCAIAGIGDIGSPQDAAEIEHFLEHPHAPICRAAAIALMRLDAEKYAPAVAEKLISENESVFAICTKLLRKYKILDFTRINEIFGQIKNGQAKLRCLSLLFLAPKWRRLIYILTYRHGESEEIRAACEHALALWFEHFNRSYTAATHEEKAEICRLIAREDGEIRARIEFFLGNSTKK